MPLLLTTKSSLLKHCGGVFHRYSRSTCAPCEQCNPPFSYKYKSCSPSTNEQTVCKQCSKCLPDYYISRNCSNFSDVKGGSSLDFPGQDVECTRCTRVASTCVFGKRPKYPCTGNTYRDNTECVDCTEQYPDDYYQQFECKPMECGFRPGVRGCSEEGGQYVKRCTGSPTRDTSECLDCK